MEKRPASPATAESLFIRLETATMRLLENPPRLIRCRTDVDVLHLSHDPAVIAHRVLARAPVSSVSRPAVFHGHRAESQGIAVGYAGFVEGTHQEPAHIGEASAAVSSPLKVRPRPHFPPRRGDSVQLYAFQADG